MTPDEAWTKLGLDTLQFEDSSLDYTDSTQKSKSVMLLEEGASEPERWVVLVMKR